MIRVRAAAERSINSAAEDSEMKRRQTKRAAVTMRFVCIIPAGNEPGDCLQAFGGCREGQVPR